MVEFHVDFGCNSWENLVGWVTVQEYKLLPLPDTCSHYKEENDLITL